MSDARWDDRPLTISFLDPTTQYIGIHAMRDRECGARHAELLTLSDQVGAKFRGIGTMGSSFTGRLFIRVHVPASMIVDTYALTR